MDSLGLSLGYLLVQILNLILSVGLPLVLLFFVYRWMLGVQQSLERVEKRLQALDEHLEEVLDYLAEQEEGR
ncbi:MAG TPA: hypothetical protein G4O04_02520 [Anaerolineae bacterium]|nr:hypothetical protein [Anaerolineae bacterium]HID83746.1 hypothetical protein [Anaerolineales bacterium]HIQ08671.1 hypothetical protein [Anaerolineaceae bacterium]